MLLSLGGLDAAALSFFIYVPLFAPLEMDTAWTYGQETSVAEAGLQFLMGGTFMVSERASSLPWVH